VTSTYDDYAMQCPPRHVTTLNLFEVVCCCTSPVDRWYIAVYVNVVHNLQNVCT